MRIRYPQGATYYGVWVEPSSSVTSATMHIMRLSDGLWWDTVGGDWAASSYTGFSMTEDDNGVWRYSTGWTIPSADNEYQVIVIDDSSYVYQQGIIVVDNTNWSALFNAACDTAISDGALATAAELAKVPKSDGTSSWNATALAAINAECDTAISDANLTLPAIQTFTVQASPSPSTTSFGSGITYADADQVANMWVRFDADTTTSALRNQTVQISASTTAGVLTVSALTSAPSSGDTGIIF